jgi:hypothetical protein
MIQHSPNNDQPQKKICIKGTAEPGSKLTQIAQARIQAEQIKIETLQLAVSPEQIGQLIKQHPCPRLSLYGVQSEISTSPSSLISIFDLCDDITDMDESFSENILLKMSEDLSRKESNEFCLLLEATVIFYSRLRLGKVPLQDRLKKKDYLLRKKMCIDESVKISRTIVKEAEKNFFLQVLPDDEFGSPVKSTINKKRK